MRKVRGLSIIAILLLVLQLFSVSFGLGSVSQAADNEVTENNDSHTFSDDLVIEEESAVDEESNSEDKKPISERKRLEEDTKSKESESVVTKEKSKTLEVSDVSEKETTQSPDTHQEISLMAIGTPGHYNIDQNAIVVPTELKGQSTNAHTIPQMLWANGDKVYVAVKSTHTLQYMDLNDVRNVGSEVYDPWISVFVDGTEYKPEGLKGNTKDAHWTVFEFNLADLNLEDDSEYPFFVTGIGGGHDVGGHLLFEIPKTDVEAKKVWVGGTKHSAVTLQLMAQVGNEEKKIILTGEVDGTETPAWTYTWADVPQYDPYGRVYTFTADEETVPVNYEKSIDGLTVTNTYNPKSIDLNVNKEWIGPEAELVTIKLFANGEDTGRTIELNKDTNWSNSFTELNKYDDKTGDLITYTVEEVKIPGYSTEKSGSVEDGFTFTNTNDVTIDLSVEKKWVGSVVGPVKIKLLANGEDTENILTLSEDNHWTDSFKNLRKYDAVTGEIITYTIKEVDVPADYDVNISEEDGKFIVTNTARYGSLTVEKVDEEDQPLADATFELQDSKGNVVGTFTTGDDGTIKFEDLEWGDYKLVETKAPEGYRLLTKPLQVTIDADNLNVELVVENTKADWDLPPTGGIGTILFYALGTILMAGAILFLIKRKSVNT